MAGSTQDRSYTAARFEIEVEGKAIGPARSVEGGTAVGEVVLETIGPDDVIRKHIGGVAYEDLVLEVGAGLSEEFYDWIASTLDHKEARKDGAVSFQDINGTEKTRLSWFEGLIAEIGFPALDLGSREAGNLVVKVRPASTRQEPPSGAKTSSPAARMRKAWMRSNFRLTIGGVDCSRVSKIGAITIRQEPAGLEIPNLVLTLASSHGSDFVAWHEDFVIKGNNGQSHEKSGRIELLTADMKDAVFTIDLRGLGIVRVSPLKTVSGSEGIARIEAELYCEEMSFGYLKAAAASGGTVPPANGGTAPPATGGSAGGTAVGAAATAPASVLAAALRELLAGQETLGPAVASPETVATRLLTATGADGGAGTGGDGSGGRGRRLGAAWARDRATLEELEQAAAMQGGDWTDLVLAEGHSLLAYLEDAGIVPETHDGPLDLERDPFVEGLVDGAADVYEDVKPHLGERARPERR